MRKRPTQTTRGTGAGSSLRPHRSGAGAFPCHARHGVAAVPGNYISHGARIMARLRKRPQPAGWAARSRVVMAVRGRAAAIAAAMAAVDRRLPNLEDFAGQSWSAWVERAGPPAVETGERTCPARWPVDSRRWRGEARDTPSPLLLPPPPRFLPRSLPHPTRPKQRSRWVLAPPSSLPDGFFLC